MAESSQRRGQMTDDELLHLIAQAEKASLGSEVAAGATVGTTYYSSAQVMTTLEIDRFNALNMYYARPLGNEVENSSQVVLPELRDTVEWIMPQLMRIFAAARTPCVFDPEGPHDVEQAQVETEAVRHIFMAENEGFFILHDFCKDALLLRNGYIKVYLETRTSSKIENYSGLTLTELTEILSDDRDENIEVLEQREYLADIPPEELPNAAPPGAMPPSQPPGQPPGAPQGAPGALTGAPAAPRPGVIPGSAPGAPGAPPGIPPGMQPTPAAPAGSPSAPGGSAPMQLLPQAGQAMPPSPLDTGATVFDIKIRRTKTEKKIRVACVPPEEMRISARARTNLDSADFVCHRTQKSRSDLIKDGHDEDVVNAAAPGSPRWLEMDALARDVVVDQMSVDNQTDFSMQEVEFRDVSMQVDFDGDGRAELRNILIAGDKIIANEEIEEVPFASGVPKRMPHRHTGLSMYDELADIQVIKSELVRQGLNNLRLANNGRTAVDWKNCNLTDLMTSRAGGIVRTNGNPSAVLMPFQNPSNLMEQVIPMMQYVDTWREFRTGVGKDTVGIDADALQNVTKGGQLAGMAAAGLKIELIARCLAEGLKDAFLKVRALMVRHQSQGIQFQMRGKWVTVDPTQWRERTRVSPNVGLGSGTREDARSNLASLFQMQQQLAPLGLVGPKQAYETFKTGMTLLGFDQPERYAMDPSSEEYQQWMAQHPPPPNPGLQVAQMRLQGQQMKEQGDMQRAQLQAQTDHMTAQAQLAAEQARSQSEITHAAIQSREDRAVDMANLDMQGFMALAKLLAPIVAQQLKGDPNANAGQALRTDVVGLIGMPGAH